MRVVPVMQSMRYGGRLELVSVMEEEERAIGRSVARKELSVIRSAFIRTVKCRHWFLKVIHEACD